MGFWCEVDGGDEIRVDHVELDEGAWVSREELRATYEDTGISLTGEMIAPWRDYALLAELQAIYEEEQAKAVEEIAALVEEVYNSDLEVIENV